MHGPRAGFMRGVGRMDGAIRKCVISPNASTLSMP